LILAGDIGGTKTNLALCDDAGAPVREATYAAKDFDSLEAIVDTFIAAGDRVTAACFGVAGPVVDGAAKITNLPWRIREDALAAKLGAPVSLLNDLQATALGALVIPASSFAVLQAGAIPERATIAVIAPGTGLGEATLFHDGARYRALPSEGGHADFAPTSDEEIELLRYLRGRYNDHVSVERVLSGNGIGDLYAFARHGAAEPAWLASADDKNAAISDAGLAGTDPIAAHAIDLFAQALGAEAGNLALRSVATGGVVIGGGIPPKLLPALQRGSLALRFNAKGRFSTWTRALSVRVALDPKMALLGAARHAALTKDQG
jgi:glucokinase